MASSRPTTAAVRYLASSDKWDIEKPYQIIGKVSPGQPKDNLEFDSHVVNIHDLSNSEEEPSLSTFGFEWLHQEFTESLQDKDSINRHIASLELLIKARLGAKAVYTYSQQLRKRFGDANTPRIRPPSNFIHIDMTAKAVEKRLKFNFPESAQISTTGRLQMVSVWHPLFSPIEDHPIALCDARTVKNDDLVASDYILPNFESETYCVKFNPSHRWYYKSDQTENQLLLILNSDSVTGIKTPHTGFLLAGARPDARPRESFEAKMIVVL